MIDNVEQLIEKANLIDSEEERVKFIMNYFLSSVEYDYSYLLAKGYMQGTISEIGRRDLTVNPFKTGSISMKINGEQKDYDDSYVFEQKPSVGESTLYDRILKLKEDMKGNKEGFYIKLQELLEQELLLHLGNEEIVKKEISSLIGKIQAQMRTGIIHTSPKGESYFIANDISRVLSLFLLDSQGKYYFPVVVENGLLKRGVCQHYADYLADFFPKIGIEAHRIDGTSELGHAWIAVKVDGKYKSIDLTRAIFIRDGFKGIPKEQTSDMWLLCDFEDGFAMQSTRTITGHDSYTNEQGEVKPIPFDYTIDGSNFSQETFANALSSSIEIKPINK